MSKFVTDTHQRAVLGLIQTIFVYFVVRETEKNNYFGFWSRLKISHTSRMNI